MVLGYDNDFPAPQGSFKFPVVPPDVDPDDGDLAVVCFSTAWLPYVYGALQQLTLQATWQGTPSELQLTLDRAMELLDLFHQNGTQCPGLMVIRDLRYDDATDQVQQTWDDGDTWTDVPQLDPRTSPVFLMPPPGGDDPRCQAAANIVRFLEILIDDTLFNIAAGLDAVGITLVFVPLFVTLGPFALLIDLIGALAAGLFSAGATAISGAFTVPAYEELTCIIYCNIEGDGSISQAQLDAINSQVSTDIGGLFSATLSAMFFLTGPVGLQNMGATGAAPADCDACPCGWRARWDGSNIDDIWSVAVSGGVYLDGWNCSTVFVSGDPARPRRQVFTRATFDSSTITYIHYDGDVTYGTTVAGFISKGFWKNNFTTAILSTSVQGPLPMVWTGSEVLTDLGLILGSGASDSGGSDLGNGVFNYVEIHGDGDPPSQFVPYLF